MTVIVWDGKTLAADRQTSGAYVKYGTSTKIGRAPDGGLYGFAGKGAINREILNWFLTGADAEKFPAIGRDKEDFTSLLWVTTVGKLRLYERGPYPIELSDTQYALGVGQEAAMGALLAGCDAVKAVEIASLVVNGCGNGIDAMELATS